jgi:RNA polymerase sigma factor (sigma-70 family)
MEDYHSGDDYRINRSKEEAIRSLEGFIFTIIKRKYSTYAPKHFNDLIQEGRAGVLEGMKKYDPELGMPTTFFNPYIKHELQSYITKIVDKTTTHYSTNIKKVNKAIDFFEEKGIQYTLVDIAIQTKMTPEAVKQAMSVRNYRDEIHFESCPRETVPDLKIIQKVITPEEELIENERINIVHECIAKYLNEEEIQVICLYFGIGKAKSYTEGKIAKKLNIPKDKVKRLLNSAQRKLIDSDLKFYYKDYLAKDRELIENSEMTFVPVEMARNAVNDLALEAMNMTEIPI